jgi:hypothetical protein
MLAVDGAEAMTREAQNAFLKSLEEPPADTVIMLMTRDATKLLPTVVSRCRRLHYREAEVLQAEAMVVPDDLLEQLKWSTSSDSFDAGKFISTMSHKYSLRLRADDPATGTQGLEALEHLQRNLSANVSVRNALTAFFLEVA